MEATENQNDDHDRGERKECDERKECKDRKDCYPRKDCRDRKNCHYGHDRRKCHDDHKDHKDHKDNDCDHHSSHHIHELEKTIKALADSLANLGRGAHLQELLRVIHCPGWTSAAEFAFVNAILDNLSVEVRTLDRLQADLVEASRKVTHKHR